METQAVRSELVPGSSRIVFLFGGIQGGLAMPPFEFYKAANVIDCSKVFLRDLAQSWYQKGLAGIGDDAQAVAGFLAQQIRDSGATDVRFVGNSMGGYAALMFCALLKTGRAIAFAPQTFIDRPQRQANGDSRWEDQLSRLHAQPRGTDLLDLVPCIEREHPGLEADVYYSSADELDGLHARRLGGFPNVRLHHYREGGHNLVRFLRDRGALAGILQ